MTSDRPSAFRGICNLLLFLGTIALLGAMLAHFSIGNHPRFLNRQDSVDSQKAILERRPFVYSGFTTDYPSWRSRILTPYAIQALSSATRLTFSQSYVLLRWLSASLALAAFATLVARQCGGGYAFGTIGAALLALALFPTFLHIYEIPTDFFDAFFFSVLTLLILEKKRALFALVLLLAATNREAAVFATFVWFAVHGVSRATRTLLREGAYCACVGAAGAALVLWLRIRFAAIWVTGVHDRAAAIRQPMMPFVADPLWLLRGFLRHPYFGSPFFFLIGYLLLFPILLGSRWKEIPAPLRRTAVAAGVIFAISVPFANLPEIRVYIPSIVILTFVSTWLLRRRICALPAPSLPPGSRA